MNQELVQDQEREFLDDLYDEQDFECDHDIYVHVRQDCVNGGRSVRTR